MSNSVEKSNHIVDRIFASIYADAECVLYIDNQEQTYRTMKNSLPFGSGLRESGTLDDLYELLFSGVKKDSKLSQNNYRLFFDKRFFGKEKYQGTIYMTDNGIKHELFLYLTKISETEAGMIISSIEDKIESDRMELEKMDTLQESYLFSMIVNLKDDSCINPNTTEINASRQDYMELKYSDWRMMISNMFMESDRQLFFRMSSPEHIINTLEEQNLFEFEVQMLNMQGKYIWVRLCFTRMKNFSRENPRFVYTVRDINREMLRLLNQESIIKAVEEQNEHLQVADQAKTKFFSSMSHEIRTPINAIMGMDEVILREAKEENIRSYARDIQNASKFLLSIVNDILDYSKIEAGKMEIVPVEYHPADMLGDICNLIRLRIEEKSLNFSVNISHDLPGTLYGDEIRITQVILNLLSNAAKYTQQGTISFIVRPTTTPQGQFALEVIVEDTGIGIRQEDLERLFSDYERLDMKRNRNVEGTGLGMSIVVGLLDRMDGKLEVQSTYGEGSRFSFVLPQKVVDANPVPLDGRGEPKTDKKVTMEPLDASDKYVLVVDDAGINLRVAKALLSPYQMKVDLVNSGKQCLEKLTQNSYDLIFLDHMMPEMDGIETLHAIRELGNKYETMPIIALTANAPAEARDQYRSYGFTDYLEKPMKAEQLNQIIHTYLV